MEPTHIEVTGARVHNLRNVALRLPRNALICFTGVSGSGKSSLAFDTLYAEGQRRYIESLSSYARQFLGQIEKPDCDAITGLSPAIAIQQKTAGQNPRSTVGTITAVYDFLRVLYARVGLQHCTQCGGPIAAQSREQIVAGVLDALDGRRAILAAPLARGQKGEFRDLFDDLRRAGFIRARVDGAIVELREEIALEKNKKHDIEVVIDRLVVSRENRGRLAEAVENGLRLGDGTVIAWAADDAHKPATAGSPKRSARTEGADLLFSAKYACMRCRLSYEPPTPQLFSFNAPAGMCPRCDGLGESFDFDPDLVVPNDRKHFLSPCIAPMRTKPGRWRRHIYQGVADHLGINLRTPWRDLPTTARDALLYGTGDTHITFTWRWSGGLWKHGDTFDGVIAELREKYRKAAASFVRAYYEKFMRRRLCPDCRGARLNPQARAVRLHAEDGRSAKSRPLKGKTSTRALARARTIGPSINELCARPVSEILETIRSLKLNPIQQQIARDVLKEITARLEFLMNVGLHYLTLDRTAPTLSGGEAQRIRLAGQIGSGLTGVLYVLDEPSIGLHPRDNRQLLDSLRALADMGNTVLVVEHDEDTMRAADHIVDFGPGPGVRGGHVVAEGPLDVILKSKASLTGQYLRGERKIETPSRRRPVGPPPSAPRSRRRG